MTSCMTSCGLPFKEDGGLPFRVGGGLSFKEDGGRGLSLEMKLS